VSDRLALANAIEEAGIERSKAERVASVIVAAIYDHAATKADVQASETAVRADVAQLSATTRTDLTTMRGDLACSAPTAMADVQAVRGEIACVGALLASETARLDTRIERLDATVKAQPTRSCSAWVR
jgi:tRNA U34 5-carboxymethylaminomethyl modifying GTPase MnmE/TrmE